MSLFIADLATPRNVVLALGVMFGLIPNGYTVFDNLLHLALGVLSLAVALFSPGDATATQR